MYKTLSELAANSSSTSEEVSAYAKNIYDSIMSGNLLPHDYIRCISGIIIAAKGAKENVYRNISVQALCLSDEMNEMTLCGEYWARLDNSDVMTVPLYLLTDVFLVLSRMFKAQDPINKVELKEGALFSNVAISLKITF